MKKMNFGQAIEALKQGKAIQREDQNNKNLEELLGQE